MRQITIRLVGGALALTLLVPGAAAYAAVTFLGVSGSADNGRAVVGWTLAGVPDSSATAFGMTPGTLFADSSFSTWRQILLPDQVTFTMAGAQLTIAPAGPADRTAPVAYGGIYLQESGYASSPERYGAASVDFALRYAADQPTIYWALIETFPLDDLEPGPPGEVMVSHPAPYLSSGGGGETRSAGSAPNTGEFEVSALVRAIRPEGEPVYWVFDQTYRIYLSGTPLDALVTGVGPGGSPDRVALAAPRPNPSSGTTTLTFALPVATHATLEILDVAGRYVRTLLDGELPAGTTSVRWDGADARGTTAHAGIYFARLVAGGERRVQRLVLMR